MAEKELKPCPFCGYEFPTITYHKIVNTYYVACPHCQSVFRLDCTAGHDSDKNKTIEAWNRRSDNGKL